MGRGTGQGRWSIGARTAIAALLAVGVGAVAPPAAAAPVAPAVPACSAEQPDTAHAVAMARLCGYRVEALDQRTETDRVLANPSGTLSLERAIAPQRVRRPDGTWTPIDTTLVFDAAGGVVPRASSAAMRFSAGGDGRLADIAIGGDGLSLSWPGRLPTPTLSGDSALYPEVLPAVDLQVRATVTGLTYALVVKTRAAAANPALRQLRLPVRGKGLHLRQRPGGVEAVDRTGKVILASADASMWDSAVGTGAADPERQQRLDSLAAAGTIRGRSGSPLRSTAVEPGERASRAAVGVRLDGARWCSRPTRGCSRRRTPCSRST
jgi:hypothetical protein